MQTTRMLAHQPGHHSHSLLSRKQKNGNFNGHFPLISAEFSFLCIPLDYLVAIRHFLRISLTNFSFVLIVMLLAYLSKKQAEKVTSRDKAAAATQWLLISKPETKTSRKLKKLFCLFVTCIKQTCQSNRIAMPLLCYCPKSPWFCWFSSPLRQSLMPKAVLLYSNEITNTALEWQVCV